MLGMYVGKVGTGNEGADYRFPGKCYLSILSLVNVNEVLSFKYWQLMRRDKTFITITGVTWNPVQCYKA